jgi:hypothetical protein
MIACFHAVGIYEVDRHLLKNNRSFSNVLELNCLSISLDIDEGPVAFFEGRSDIIFDSSVIVIGDSTELYQLDLI